MSDLGADGSELEPTTTAPSDDPPTTDPAPTGPTPTDPSPPGEPSGEEGSPDTTAPADPSGEDGGDGPDPSSPPTTSPSSPSTRTIEDRDIGLTLPPGWEGEIYRRAPEPVEHGPSVPRARRLQPTTRSIAHIGSFPLPPDRGDYGSGAVEIMRDEDVLIVLFEFEPDSATETMFAHEGIPHPLRASDFDPNQMQRPLPGMAGVQRFFNVGGQRSFCLYVVIGAYRRRQELVGRINEVLAAIHITA